MATQTRKSPTVLTARQAILALVEHGMTDAEIATEAACTTMSIYNWRTGKTPPLKAYRENLARVYEKHVGARVVVSATKN